MRRDQFRRSLLRANTGVGVMIAMVLALALAAMWQSGRATRLQAAAEENQSRAERAEENAQLELWRAQIAEARATRLGQTIGRRETALETLRRAASFSRSAELRDEAIATLALPDYRLESTVPLDASVRSHMFDHELRWCALGMTNGDVVIRRLSDAGEVRRFRQAEIGIPAEQGPPLGMEFARGGGALTVRYQRGAMAVLDLESGAARFVRDADQLRRTASRALFSSDGRHVVAPVFTPDGFEVMDARTGATIARFPEISSYHHAAVRPGTNQFAAYSGSEVLLMDWDTGAILARYAFPAGSRVLAWSGDGRWLGIGGNTPRVQVWDVPAHRMLELPGHKADVFDLQFDAVGERLASVSLDLTTRLWDLRDAHLAAVADDRRLARWGTGGLTGWSVSKERLEVRRDVDEPPCASLVGPPEQTDGETLDISPDGNWAVSAAGPDSLMIWNLRDRRGPEFVPMPNLQSVCFHPTQPVLLLMRNFGIEERAWQVGTEGGKATVTLGEPVPRPTVPGRRTDLVTTSLDGRTRAYVGLSSGSVWIENLDPEPLVLPVQQILHSSVLRRSGSARGTGTLALSPDGRWLVVGADGSRGTCLFNAHTGEPLRDLDPDYGGVQFSPDGRWLVLVSPRYSRVFRTSDWSVVWTKASDPRHPSYAGAAAFSPDGTRVACVVSAHRARLVSTEDGRELGVLEAPDRSPITVARWSGDGRRLVLATRDNHLNVWQTDVLDRELAALGLGGDVAGRVRPPERRVSGESGPPAGRWIIPTLLAGAAVAAGIALALLRHHRRLIGEFSEAEALAARRERELQAERELNELKSRFVSMVSHEFRTPLGITMSAVELLRNHLELLDDAQRKELFEDIHASTRQMAGLMEQVLLLGRVESGRLAFRPAAVDLAVLCGKLADESLSATHHRCPITVDVEHGVASAQADESLLRHIFSNLLSNAVKYSPAGGAVHFTLARRGEHAIFTVADRGLGIPAADIPGLFQPFHRAGNVGDLPGTGLGLAIVKRCVDLHGGTIDLRSQPGEGTTFVVSVPVFRSAP